MIEFVSMNEKIDWRELEMVRYIMGVIVVILCMLTVIPTEASVGTGTLTDKNLKITYPIVYIDNNINAQDKINSDIANYVYSFKGEYDDGKFYSGKCGYEVKYEDEKYISIMFIEMRYMYGAAHTWDSGRCITYDKITGEKIALPYFVRIASEDLGFILSLPIYDWYDKVIPYTNNFAREYKNSGHAKISTDYYLAGNGEIALVYPPYALAPYSAGFTHIILKEDMIDYLNRKNP